MCIVPYFYAIIQSMNLLQTIGWKDYSLLDSGEGRRLEKFGEYILDRPDPDCLWQKTENPVFWQQAHAKFEKDKLGKDYWSIRKKMPKNWQITYDSVTLSIRLSPFKHTGLFPEQQPQWDILKKVITSPSGQVGVLNLFAYTGASSMIALSSGASVVHVDSSKPSLSWARENQILSGLSDKPIRFILEDAYSFVKREVRRGSKYDIILMDPPVYGHGPKGETWQFSKDFPLLLQDCKKLFSQKPLLFLINAYAISSSSLMLGNMLSDMFGSFGNITYGELGIEQKNKKRALSTGIF